MEDEGRRIDAESQPAVGTQRSDVRHLGADDDAGKGGAAVEPLPDEAGKRPRPAERLIERNQVNRPDIAALERLQKAADRAVI